MIKSFIQKNMFLAIPLLLNSCGYVGFGAGDIENIEALVDPRVLSIEPENGQENVLEDTKIIVKFSKSINVATVTSNSANTSCNGSIQVSNDDFSTCIQMLESVELSNDDKTVELTPQTDFVFTENYKIKVTESIQDKNGNALSLYLTADGFDVREEPIIYLYSQGAASGGNLGNRATTTTACQVRHDMDYSSLQCTQFAALLAYGSEDNAIDILDHFMINDGKVKSHNGTLITYTWAELFDAADDEENLVDAGVSTGAQIWTGFNREVASSMSYNCDSWTSSIDNGSVEGSAAQVNAITGSIKTIASYNCGLVSLEYICVCQP